MNTNGLGHPNTNRIAPHVIWIEYLISENMQQCLLHTYTAKSCGQSFSYIWHFRRAVWAWQKFFWKVISALDRWLQCTIPHPLVLKTWPTELSQIIVSRDITKQDNTEVKWKIAYLKVNIPVHTITIINTSGIFVCSYTHFHLIT